MKLIKTANGKQKLKLTRSEWEGIGKKAGWLNVFALQSGISYEKGAQLIAQYLQKASQPSYNWRNPKADDIELLELEKSKSR